MFAFFCLFLTNTQQLTCWPLLQENWQSATCSFCHLVPYPDFSLYTQPELRSCKHFAHVALCCGELKITPISSDNLQVSLCTTGVWLVQVGPKANSVIAYFEKILFFNREIFALKIPPAVTRTELFSGLAPCLLNDGWVISQRRWGLWLWKSVSLLLDWIKPHYLQVRLANNGKLRSSSTYQTVIKTS